jgi:hypothetical protein
VIVAAGVALKELNFPSEPEHAAKRGTINQVIERMRPPEVAVYRIIPATRLV